MVQWTFLYELRLKLNIGVTCWKILKNPWFLKLQRMHLQYPFSPWNSKGRIYITQSVLETQSEAYKIFLQWLHFFFFHYLFAFSISSLSICIDYTFNIILQSYYLNKIFVSSNPILLKSQLDFFQKWQIDHWLPASYC